MFSYDVKIRAFNGQGSTRAFAVLVVDGVLEVQGFKVIEGRNGLFVSAPNTKSNKIDDKTGKNVYFDDVRFTDPKAQDTDRRTPLQEEIYGAILSKYNETVSGNARGSAASAHTAVPIAEGGRPNVPGQNGMLF
jgi:DNA-binding cell septation regulator SpoVG